MRKKINAIHYFQQLLVYMLLIPEKGGIPTNYLRESGQSILNTTLVQT
jgi:hypothetical protein